MYCMKVFYRRVQPQMPLRRLYKKVASTQDAQMSSKRLVGESSLHHDVVAF